MPLFTFFAIFAKKVLAAKKSSDKRDNSLLTFLYKLNPELYAIFAATLRLWISTYWYPQYKRRYVFQDILEKYKMQRSRKSANELLEKENKKWQQLDQ